MKKYVQQHNLPTIFDVSVDYFKNRIGVDFFEDIHFFVPIKSSKTKKVVFWDVQKVEEWIRGNRAVVQNDELNSLLNRR